MEQKKKTHDRGHRTLILKMYSSKKKKKKPIDSAVHSVKQEGL